jgi:hypothetical protein
MVDLFCHNLGAIKTHTLLSSFAKIEPMELFSEILLLILATYVIGSCVVALAELITWYAEADKFGENKIISRKHITIVVLGLLSLIMFDYLGMYRFPFT